MSAAATTRAGLVVAAHGRHCLVEPDGAPHGATLRCHARGKRSDVVVGDRVRFAPAGDEGVVEAVEPRRSLLARRDAWRTKAFAANVDAALVLLAVEPNWSESQLARVLVACADAGIDAAIALNKVDLPGAEAMRARLAPHAGAGVPIVELSLRADADGARRALAPRLAGRTTLVLGPSGMGKSTLVNQLVDGAAARVGEISSALASGRHTTTTTTWYWLGGGFDAGARRAALIDSPGFQEFGIHQIAPADLARRMPDLAAHADGCRFGDCTHLHEPGCAVLAALARGEIAPQRHRLYAELRAELDAAPRW